MFLWLEFFLNWLIRYSHFTMLIKQWTCGAFHKISLLSYLPLHHHRMDHPHRILNIIPNNTKLQYHSTSCCVNMHHWYPFISIIINGRSLGRQKMVCACALAELTHDERKLAKFTKLQFLLTRSSHSVFALTDYS